jgi:hypothetical protein
MGYKAYGVIVEGIWCDDSLTTPAIFGGGILTREQAILVDGNFHRFKPDLMASGPQLSSTDLDVFTGLIRSGSITIRLNAVPEVTTRFLAQNITRQPDLVNVTQIGSTAGTVEVSGTPVIGGFYYFGEEIIRIDSLVVGNIYNITRACGLTKASPHFVGDGLYSKPNFWIGRIVKVIVMDFNDQFNPTFAQTPTDVRVVWQGVLTEAPQTISQTSIVELKADSVLSTLGKREINRIAYSFSTGQAATTFLGSNPETIVLGLLENDEVTEEYKSRVYKDDDFVANGRIRPVQVGGSVAISFNRNIVSIAEVGSPQYVEGDIHPGPFYELAIWNKFLDQKYQTDYSIGISPTYNCDYPYHPLTIAAALLFSSQDPNNSDPSVFDVMHPQFSAGLDYLLDAQAWIDLIEETPAIEIDLLVLGWDGEPVEIFDLVVKKLLPAYGFALTMSADGLIIPIQIGLVDIAKYASAPSLEPLPEYWEWKNIGSEVLDQVIARVGDRPWKQGTSVVLNGTSVRNDLSGRSSRNTQPTKVEYNFPTIAATQAQNFALSNLINILIWRFDGLPQITLRLPMTNTLYAGQFIKLTKPRGLITPILYDLEGTRVDNWGAYSLIGQILSLRPIIESQYYEAKILLPNYVLGDVGKYRAPACRIKEVLGSGQYVIEGLTSDFKATDSDANRFAQGDEVELYDTTLAPSANYATVVSVSAPGPDVTLTLDGAFSPEASAGDWIVLAPSSIYENSLRYGVEFLYPFVFMTDGALLNRPGSLTTDPDKFI